MELQIKDKDKVQKVKKSHRHSRSLDIRSSSEGVKKNEEKSPPTSFKPLRLFGTGSNDNSKIKSSPSTPTLSSSPSSPSGSSPTDSFDPFIMPVKPDSRSSSPRTSIQLTPRPLTPNGSSPPIFQSFSSIFRIGSPPPEEKKYKKEKEEQLKRERKEKEEKEKREKREKQVRKKREREQLKVVGKSPAKSIFKVITSPAPPIENDWVDLKNPNSNGGKGIDINPKYLTPNATGVSRSFEETTGFDDFILRSRSNSSPSKQEGELVKATGTKEAEDYFSQHPHHHHHNPTEELGLETEHTRIFKFTGHRDENRYAPTIDDKYMVGQSITWQNVKIPTARTECSTQLKYLLRKGIPDYARGTIWRTIAGFNEYNEKNPTAYKDARNNVFGDKIPKYIFRVPTFGGVFRSEDHYLTEEGSEAAKRILCTLAMENPTIEYLPVIPDLVCILLHFMEESNVYAVASLMLSERNPNRYYFKPTKKGITLFLYTFDDLLNKHAQKIYAHMKALSISSHHFADEWFLRLFVSTFPFQTVLRIFDAFINEGSKVLYRVALAFMKLNKDALLLCSSTNGFLDTLRECASRCTDVDELMKKAFSLRIRWKLVQQFNKKNAPKLASVIEPSTPVYYRPKVVTPSAIIADEQFEVLWSWLPHKFAITDPTPLFSSKTDGFSYKYFLEKSAKEYPTILVVKTTLGEVFGAFVTDPWAIHRGYYGTRDCFLWTFSPKPQKYGWVEGSPDYFMLITPQMLQVGGGDGMGLWIDKDFQNGRTEKCNAFQNSPLTKDGRSDFEIAAIELYSFK